MRAYHIQCRKRYTENNNNSLFFQEREFQIKNYSLENYKGLNKKRIKGLMYHFFNDDYFTSWKMKCRITGFGEELNIPMQFYFHVLYITCECENLHKIYTIRLNNNANKYDCVNRVRLLERRLQLYF